MIGNRMRRTFLPIAVRLAVRNLRGSALRSLFVVGVITLSVAAVTSISHSASVIRSTLLRDAKSWLTGDVAVETNQPVSDAQIGALERMRADGIEWTMVTFSLAMIASDAAPDPVYTTIKVVDPATYPFYGAPRLRGAASLRDALSDDRVVVSHDALDRLRVRPGDRIRLGGRHFRVAAASVGENEHPFGVIGWGPRITMSERAFDNVAVALAGNTRLHRVILRLPPNADPRTAKEILQTVVPEGRVMDYHDEARPTVSRIELAISFASVCAFLGVVLGGIGVGTAIRLHLDRRIATFAILRVEGARTLQMISLVLIETALLIAASLPVGLGAGWAFGELIVSLADRYLNVPTSPFHDWMTLVVSGLAGLMMMAPLLIGPMNAIARLRPTVLMRVQFPESRPPLRLARATLFSAMALAAAAALLVANMIIRARMPALLLTGAMCISALMATLLSSGLVWSAKRWAASRTCPTTLRPTLAGLQRAGANTSLLIASLALGVMAIGSTVDNGAAIAQTVMESLPYAHANLLVTNFSPAHRDRVTSFLKGQSGVIAIDMRAEIWLRLVAIDGHAVEPESFAAQCEPGATATVIANDLASRLHVQPGSRVDFDERDGVFSTVIGEVRIPSPRERFWMTLIVDCHALPEAALMPIAAVEAGEERLPAVRRAIIEAMPSLAAISADEILSTVQSVTSDVLRLARLAVWLTAVASVLILIAMVASTRGARVHEIAILAALGASRRAIRKRCAMEFLVAGMLAAIVGNLLRILFSGAVFRILFYRNEWPADWRTAAILLAACPAVTIAAGWLPLRPLLRLRPLEVLREE